MIASESRPGGWVSQIDVGRRDADATIEDRGGADAVGFPFVFRDRPPTQHQHGKLLPTSLTSTKLRSDTTAAHLCQRRR